MRWSRRFSRRCGNRGRRRRRRSDDRVDHMARRAAAHFGYDSRTSQPEEESMKRFERTWQRACIASLSALMSMITLVATDARAADTLNVYSIWPENWARPMFEEFEKASG